MSNKPPFEQWMKSSLEGYEAPYDPSAWEGIEKELDRMDASEKRPNSRDQGKQFKKWSAWAAGAGILIVASTLLYTQVGEEKEKADKQGPKVEANAQKELREGNEVHRGEKEEHSGNAAQEKEKADSKGSKADAPNEEGTRNEELPDDHKGNKKASEASTEKDQEQALADLQEGNGSNEEEANGNDPTNNGDAPGKEEQADKGNDRLPSEVTIRASAQEGCPPFKVSFSTAKTPKGVDYFWDLGNGSYSNKAEPTHRYDEGGTYDVKLTLTDRESGKTMTVTEESLVRVNRPPEGHIVKLEERGLRKPRPITGFRIKNAGNVERIVWQLGDGTRIEGQQRVEHRYPSKGVYVVKAFLTDETGCKDTLRFNYEQQKSYDLLAPDAFSPDGDGRNDKFLPEALKVLDVPFTLTIHDRSGKVVYKTDNAGSPWNGRFQNNGETVSAGSTFLWVVVLENERGEEESYKGHVTVVK